MKRIILSYLAGYRWHCCLLQRPFNDASGAVAPRVDGIFILALNGSISLFVRIRDDICSVYWILARIGVVLAALHCIAIDPMLLIRDAIILVGLLPSFYVLATGKHTS